MALTLDSDVKYLKGVGPKGAAALAKAEILTVRDVLGVFPRRYEDRSNMPPIALAKPGETASLRGRVITFDARPLSGGRVVMKALVKDATGSIFLTWFNQPYMRARLEDYRGEIVAYGLVKDTGLAYEIQSPDIELLEDDDDETDDFTRITPVYGLVQGLAQHTIRRAVDSALQFGLPLIEDPLSDAVRKEQRLQGLRWSLRQIHRPESMAMKDEARDRLVFDEFLGVQLGAALARARNAANTGVSFPIAAMRRGEFGDVAHALFAGGDLARLPLDQQTAAMLPFEMTNAQKRVVEEIFGDMERPHPMNRLLQGDVGAGKTAVAAIAIVAAVRAGWQAALMAPTEILAEQHAASLGKMLAPLGIPVELLVGKLTPSQKRKAQDRVASGEAPVAVGTHALVAEGAKFDRLGLAVVDEQHRFGVMHRVALRRKGIAPDVLMMTATPIPRTLTMAQYGDMDLSVIDELPPGRRAIKTRWKGVHQRDSVYVGVGELLAQGRQAYVVCPMVAESEKMLAQAAEELHRHLVDTFPQHRVGLLHGQLKSKEKEAVMDAFRAREVHVLVATTVIEVGIDVPNASVMVIEDANRFGLSQLHQLRGRVGRGADQSFCVLIADATTPDAKERLQTMVDTTDGFEIAEVDLRLRGAGAIAGTQQSGHIDFRLADMVRDGRMLERARALALATIEIDPDLSRPEHAGLRGMVRESATEKAIIAVS